MMMTTTFTRNLEAQLSQIFQRQNSYCLHVDPKADPLFLRTVQQIIQCYRCRQTCPNVAIMTIPGRPILGHRSSCHPHL